MSDGGAGVVGVEVVRGGAALALELADGSRRLVRRADLPIDALPLGARLVAARARGDGDGVDVLAEGGAPYALPGALLGLGPRPPRLVVTGARLATMAGGAAEPLGLIGDGAIVVGGDGAIAWVGRGADLADSGLPIDGVARLDAGGRLVTPGLVDCHAHPIFAGDRADEFARRAAGQSYLEIAAAGGGIAATLVPTRAASVDALVDLTCRRLATALASGTTTMEAKTGYDLTVAGELRLLEVAAMADALSPVDLVPTLLCHLVPPERKADRDAYVAELVGELIPRAAAGGVCRAVDVYCDDGAFTLAETRAMLAAGRAAGLEVRAHAGQFADLGAAALLAELGARSADHLEQIDDAGARALAAAGVVGVVLPGACVQLRLPPPPVGRLRAAGVALAIGSDLNPGSSLCETLPVQMWLAATHLAMTIEEVWLGVTRHAARVLGRADLGVLALGAAGDLVVWDAERPAEVPYRYGAPLVASVVKAGRVVAGR